MSRQRSLCIIKKDTSSGDYLDNNKRLSIHEEEDHYDVINTECDIFVKEKNTRKALKNDSTSTLTFKKPIFKNIKKEFPSIQTKSVYFHEKAEIVGNFDRTLFGDIDEHNQIIDFDRFLFQFKNEEEVRNLQMQDILDIDYEKLEELKYKATEFIDATSLLMDEKEKNGQNTESELELLLFFSQKLQEMKINEINIQIFVNNLDRVKGILYSNNGVKIFFKNS